MKPRDLLAPVSRRHFLRHLAGYSLIAPASCQFFQKLAFAGPQLKKDHKSLIILWMSGGPTHIDTFDLKPGTEHGGPFRPIAAAVPGIQISEHLPGIASQVKHLAIVRSLVTQEGDHARGTQLMHTAYTPDATIEFPSLGSVVSWRLAAKDSALPGYISISRPAEGPGFLGMTHAPFTVQDPGTLPEGLNPPADLGSDLELRERLNRRRSVFTAVEQQFVNEKRGQAAQNHFDIYRKAFALVDSPLKLVFDLTIDTNGRPMNPRMLEAYGDNPFGRGCLLARKLVESGVTAVEVDLGGWDQHSEIFAGQHKNDGTGLQDMLDRGMAALIKDLADRGLLRSTVVVWMGEFGRTPRINQNTGRDHWPNCWSIVLGGGGIRGGQVYGATNSDGTEVKDNPCSIHDVYATIFTALAIPADTEIRDPLGRPRKIIGDKPGEPLQGLV
jgi:hypothetical protein